MAARIVNISLVTEEMVIANKEHGLLVKNDRNGLWKIIVHKNHNDFGPLFMARNVEAGRMFGWCTDIETIKNHLSK